MAWGQTAGNPAPDEKQMDASLVEGMVKLRAGKAGEAIAGHFEPVIQEYETRYRDGETRVFSTANPVESLVYMLEAANAPTKKNAAVFSANWGLAYYLKGYALVELKRPVEAAAALDAAIGLAPRNSQFLAERGQLFLTEKRWAEAQKIFIAAEAAAREFSPPQARNAALGRALRGHAYTLIELEQLDEAEKLYTQCLQLNKDDRMAQGQLRYIVGLREKRNDAAAAQADPASKEFHAAWRMAEAQFISPSISGYARHYATGGIWNDQGVQRRAVMPDQKAIAECVTAISPGPGKARMVFVIDEKGMVTAAFTDQKGWVAECVTEKLIGHRVPAPPRAPMYFCSRYEKTGENTTETSNCGPLALVSVCEQAGTTKQCRFQQR